MSKALKWMPLLSGLLLSAAWPACGIPLILLFALVPLLLVENEHLKQRSNNHSFGLFIKVFPAFMVWNILTTWWIYNSTFFGAVMAILINSTLMSLSWWLFHMVRRAIKFPSQGYLSLVFIWISYEYLTHNWDLNWPWLTLGNGFASWPSLIQWYEFTGIFGGSLWILTINIIIFKLVDLRWIQHKPVRKTSIGVLLILIILPIFLSLLRYVTYTEKVSPVDVVVVQPNVDPYEEQFELPANQIIEEASALARTVADQSTDFIVFPESMVQPDWSSGMMIWENDLENQATINMFRNGLLTDFPDVSLVVGYSTYREYFPGEEAPETARKFRNSDGYYDAYNTAFLIRNNADLQLHHKSKLTPGVELMPFPWLLAPLGDLAIDLGGTVGQLGMDSHRRPLFVNDTLEVAPIICYESVFGEYVAEFVRNGANLIFIITNDGWWGDTPGHRQHAAYASVRAIETRRSIARSANTGTSCFVNQRGDLMQSTAYWVPAAIRQKLNANEHLTFYVKYGDYIARISVMGMVLFFLVALSQYLMRRQS
ncbi:MAG: apolipoprotein N-acyltransferase [Lentimicrobiaceae bacterium]|nr:apolipoprotein N-acyltransferase [Lentimicrobiaceae bacterium]